MKSYRLENVLEVLRQQGVGIDGKSLSVRSGVLGLKRLGMLDYLVNYHNYYVQWR